MVKKNMHTLLGIAFVSGLLLLSGCTATSGQFSASRAASLRRRVLLPKVEHIQDGVEPETFQKVAIPDRAMTLKEAAAIALANNHSIKISAEDVTIAAGNVGIARSLFFPQVSATYGYVHNQMQPAFVNPDNPLMPPFYAGEKEFQRAELKAQMILWDFGKTLGTYRQSTLAREIARLRSTRNAQQVRLQVAEAYFAILRAQKARLIAEESLAQAEAHARTARSFHGQGLVDKSDVLRADLQVAEVKQLLIRAKNAVELATSGFNSVLGINVNRKTEVVDTKDAPAASPGLQDALQLAVDNRPEFQVVQKSIRIQEEALTVARAEHFPRIYVGGGYNWTDDAYRKWGDSHGDVHKGAWVGEVGIAIDLFSGGRTLAKSRIARARIRQAEAQAKQLCDAIALQVKNGVLGITEARERITVATKAVAQARENLRLVNNKYRQNVASSTDVVDAETSLSKAQSNYHSAIYDCHTALARLVSAAGTEALVAQSTDPKDEKEKREKQK